MLNKKLIASAIFAVAFVATSAVAALDFGTTTLVKGSKGEAVKTLQTLVGATPVDGIFGAGTEAKVKAWQANNGLTADGKFGPASMAKANGAVSGNFPAGCTSAAGFSTTTGLSCAATPSTLPAGCVAGAAFSSTTGQACTAGTTATVTGLTGSEGSITVTDFTSGTETELAEGKTEKVLGVQVEAEDGSDVAISTMKVEIIDSTGAGSTRAERYFEEVEVYMGSTKVGSASISDFTKDSATYTKSISLTNAIVKKGEKAKFYIALKAKSVIDSNDIHNSWTVGVASVRFQDAMGVVMTDTVDQENDSNGVDVLPASVTFVDSADNDEAKLLSSSSNPAASNLKVKDNGVSDEHLVFAFKLKADVDSSDLNVLEIPIGVEPSSVSIDEVISDIYLKVGSKTYDNSDLDGDYYVFTIDEGDFEIAAGETAEVKVYAKFMKEGLTSTYDAGETVQFSVDGDLITIENTDGDAVETITSSLSGNVHTLQLEGVNFTLGTPTATVTSPSNSDNYVTFVMPLKVETDETLYILKDDGEVSYTLSGVTSGEASFTTGSGVPTLVTSGSDEYYEISGSGTVYFKVIVTGDDTGSAGTEKLQLVSIDAATEVGGTTTTYTLSPASAFDAEATLVY